MIARSRAGRSGWALAVALTLSAVAAAGCGDMFAQQPGAQTPASEGPRTAPDDSDLWNLAPASADAVAELDLAALRASPWSHALTESGLSGARDEGRRLYGYDVFTDAERLVMVMSEAGGTMRNLTIVRGTFDPARVAAAFLAATPGAAEGRWRESRLWEGGDRAVALVTPRTLVAGDPGSVRGAIDAAWGVVPDARTVPLGGARRALDADHPGPAAFIALNVTDQMRGRAAGFLELPPGLALCAARIDLADDLNAQVLGILDTPASAVAAATAGTLAVRAYAQNTMVRLLGLSSILNGVMLGAEGTRVHGRLEIPADRREGLGDKLNAVLQMVAAARH
ncbi:MAG TPA: hypothetical protein VHO06_23980 [Polyangia bacterium]|nr:hypothetical protein [Polyangia bacterium]